MPITLEDAWSSGRHEAHAQAELISVGEIATEELVEAAVLRIEDGEGPLNAVHAHLRARAPHLLDDLSYSDTLIACSVRAAAMLEELGHQVDEADPAPLVAALGVLWCYIGGNVADAVAAASPGQPLGELVEPWTTGLAERRTDVAPQRVVDAWSTLAAASDAAARFHHRWDVLLSPVTPPLPLGPLAPTRAFDELRSALFDHASFTPVQDVTGQPSISLPLARSDAGLPIGVTLSPPIGDDPLLTLAADIERAAPWMDRWPPQLRTTAALPAARVPA